MTESSTCPDCDATEIVHAGSCPTLQGPFLTLDHPESGVLDDAYPLAF